MRNDTRSIRENTVIRFENEGDYCVSVGGEDNLDNFEGEAVWRDPEECKNLLSHQCSLCLRHQLEQKNPQRNMLLGPGTLTLLLN
jgi:hypothetical protein